MKKTTLFLFPFLLLSACQEPVLTTTKGQDLTQNAPSASASPETSDTTIPADPLSVSKKVTLQGVIQEANTQKLLAGITVRLNELSQVTDEAGFFRFTDQAIGSAKLIVANPNYININRNIQLTSALQTEDIVLTPEEGVHIEPSASPPTLILLPDGTASSAPSSTPSPSPSPSPTPIVSPTPSPTEPPLVNNELNEATSANVLIQTKGADLRLTFTLNKSNGLPVNWSDQPVYIEYYIATPDNALLTSGKSLIASTGDGFVVSLGGRTATPTVNVNITLLLPNQNVILIRKTINVQGS